MKSLRIYLTFLTIILAPYQSYALQRVMLSDNGTATVEISAKEFNRIKLANSNDGILKIRANQSELEVDFESVGGEIYVKLPIATRKAPINVFILTKRGYNYKLILIPKRIPAEQIFISNKLRDPSFGKQKIYASYSNELIEIYKKISRGENKGCETNFKKRKSYLADRNDTLLIRVEQSICDKYTIEKHIVKNIGDNQISLRHEDFIRTGVKAIKLNGNNSLLPKEVRELFLIF